MGGPSSWERGTQASGGVSRPPQHLPPVTCSTPSRPFSAGQLFTHSSVPCTSGSRLIKSLTAPHSALAALSPVCLDSVPPTTPSPCFTCPAGATQTTSSELSLGARTPGCSPPSSSPPSFPFPQFYVLRFLCGHPILLKYCWSSRHGSGTPGIVC